MSTIRGCPPSEADIFRWVMAGKKGQKKWVWSDDEKLSICAQARVSGVSVAQVAQRYAMDTNLIHKWLRDPRFASEGQAADMSVPSNTWVWLAAGVMNICAPRTRLKACSPLFGTER